MRVSTKISAIALAVSLLATPAIAQTISGPVPDPTPAPAAGPPPGDPVLATVNGLPVHMSDVQAAANNLPQQMQQMPPEQLFPLLVNQEIDRRALLIAAEHEHLQKKLDVATAMQNAANEQLENAYIQQQVGPAVSDAAVAATYNKEYVGNPAHQQVDARHILLKTQADAQAVIAQLEKGADFATLATKDSLDPGAKNGGELGWFSQNEMVPAFSAAAFALQPGQYTKTPVQSQFGWHVILCEGKRTIPLADAKSDIQHELSDTAIKAMLATARSKVKIVLDSPPGSVGAPPPAQ